MSSERAFESLVQIHREWLEGNGARVLARDMAYLQGDLEVGGVRGLQTLAASLNGLAHYHGVAGLLSLIDGREEEGWGQISLSADLHGWLVRIREQLWHNRGRLPAAALNLTNLLPRAAGLACISGKWRDYAFRLLSRAVSESGAVDAGLASFGEFESFVLGCDSIRKGKPLGDQALSHYATVLSTWDQLVVGRSLVDCFDHRIQCEASETGEAWGPLPCPFDLLPCELFLIQWMRLDSGQPELEIEHWVTEALPMQAVLEIPAFPQTELVDQVEEFAENVF